MGQRPGAADPLVREETCHCHQPASQMFRRLSVMFKMHPCEGWIDLRATIIFSSHMVLYTVYHVLLSFHNFPSIKASPMEEFTRSVLSVNMSSPRTNPWHVGMCLQLPFLPRRCCQQGEDRANQPSRQARQPVLCQRWEGGCKRAEKNLELKRQHLASCSCS